MSLRAASGGLEAALNGLGITEGTTIHVKPPLGDDGLADILRREGFDVDAVDYDPAIGAIQKSVTVGRIKMIWSRE